MYTTYAFNKEFVMNTRGIYEHVLATMDRYSKENRRLKKRVADLEAMLRFGLTMDGLMKDTVSQKTGGEP